MATPIPPPSSGSSTPPPAVPPKQPGAASNPSVSYEGHNIESAPASENGEIASSTTSKPGVGAKIKAAVSSLELGGIGKSKGKSSKEHSVSTNPEGVSSGKGIWSAVKGSFVSLGQRIRGAWNTLFGPKVPQSRTTWYDGPTVDEHGYAILRLPKGKNLNDIDWDKNPEGHRPDDVLYASINWDAFKGKDSRKMGESDDEQPSTSSGIRHNQTQNWVDLDTPLEGSLDHQASTGGISNNDPWMPNSHNNGRELRVKISNWDFDTPFDPYGGRFDQAFWSDRFDTVDFTEGTNGRPLGRRGAMKEPSSSGGEISRRGALRKSSGGIDNNAFEMQVMGEGDNDPDPADSGSDGAASANQTTPSSGRGFKDKLRRLFQGFGAVMKRPAGWTGFGPYVDRSKGAISRRNAVRRSETSSDVREADRSEDDTTGTVGSIERMGSLGPTGLGLHQVMLNLNPRQQNSVGASMVSDFCDLVSQDNRAIVEGERERVELLATKLNFAQKRYMYESPERRQATYYHMGLILMSLVNASLEGNSNVDLVKLVQEMGQVAGVPTNNPYGRALIDFIQIEQGNNQSTEETSSLIMSAIVTSLGPMLDKAVKDADKALRSGDKKGIGTVKDAVRKYLEGKMHASTGSSFSVLEATYFMKYFQGLI